MSASKFRFHKSNELPRLISRGDDSASEIVALLCVALVEEILLCVYHIREEISLLDLTSNIKIGYIIY